MNIFKYLIIVVLALLNGINAILMFVLPDWFNVFAGIMIAASIPFFAAMISILGIDDVH